MLVSHITKGILTRQHTVETMHPAEEYSPSIPAILERIGSVIPAGVAKRTINIVSISPVIMPDFAEKKIRNKG